ncbi:MAG TPA: hypothetical protein VIO38_06640, partial [Rariglobus sp.]
MTSTATSPALRLFLSPDRLEEVCMIFIGTAGDDTLTDAASPGTDDGFFGLAANDLLISNSGRDTLDGDTGFDTADFSGRATSVSVNLVTGQEANSLSSL